MQKRVSLREYLMLTCVAMMSPLVKLIPSKLVERAGAGAWLSVLFVLPVVLVVIWAVWRVGRRLPEGTGLGEFLCLSMGTALGRVLCALYGIWFLLLGCLSLRFCAERFTSTIYPDTGIGLFFVALLALEWELGRQRLCVMARAGQIFFWAVLVSLAVITLLGLGSLKPYNLFPFWVQDVPRIAAGGIPVVSTLGLGIGALFLFHEVGEKTGGVWLVLRWTVVLFGLLTVLGVVVMGAFGEHLVTRLEIPFFSLAKEVSIGGAAERVEPIVVAMWMFADVTIMGVELHSAESALCCASGVNGGIISSFLPVLLAGGYLVAGSSFLLEQFYTIWVVRGEVVFFYAIPLVAVGVAKIRRVI